MVILMTVGYPDRNPPKERKRKGEGELFVEKSSSEFRVQSSEEETERIEEKTSE